MILHCDRCDRALGDNLQDIAEVAVVGTYKPKQISLPDIVCFECIEKFRPKKYKI